MKTRIFILLVLNLFGASLLLSQGDIIKEVNKNYTNKYLGSPNYNGSTTLSIPLANAQTQLYGVNLSLATALQSIKVNQLGTEVGLNWQINDGVPYISRKVRDLPDGLYRKLIVQKVCFEEEDDFDDINDCSYNDNNIFQDYCNSNEAGGICIPDQIHTKIGYLFKSEREEINESEIKYYDTKSDIYSYNIGGYHGKFIFDELGNVVHLNKENKFIKIQINHKSFVEYPNFVPYDPTHIFDEVYNPILQKGYIDKFTVTLPNGNVYTLNVKDYSSSTSVGADPVYSNHDFLLYTEPYSPQYSAAHGLNADISKWNCSVVKDHENYTLASFDYECEMIFEHSKINQSFRKGYNNNSVKSTSIYTQNAINKISNIDLYGIGDKDDINIIFKRETLRDDLEYPIKYYEHVSGEFDKKAYMLDEIRIKKNDDLYKSIEFNYGHFPEYSGYTHAYLEAHKKRYKLNSITTNIYNNDGDQTTLNPINFKYYEGMLPPRHSPNIDMFGYYNGKDIDESLLPIFYYRTSVPTDYSDFSLFNNGYPVVSSYLYNKLPVSSHLHTNILKSVKYRNGDKLELDYEPHKFKMGNNTLEGGGLRIQSSTIANTNGIQTYNYAYGTVNDIANLAMYPNYKLSQLDHLPPDPRDFKVKLGGIHNSSLNLNGKIFYEKVQVEVPNKGYIEYSYDGIHADEQEYRLKNGIGEKIFDRKDNNTIRGLYFNGNPNGNHLYFPIAEKGTKVYNGIEDPKEVFAVEKTYKALFYEQVEGIISSLVLKPKTVKSRLTDSHNGTLQETEKEFTYGVSSGTGVGLYVPRRIKTSVNGNEKRIKELRYAIESYPLMDFYSSNVQYLTPLEKTVTDKDNIILDKKELLLSSYGNDLNIDKVKEYINEELTVTKDFISYYWWGSPEEWKDKLEDVTVTHSISNGLLESKTRNYGGSVTYTTSYSEPNGWNQPTKITHPDGTEEIIKELDPLGFVAERQLEGESGTPRLVKKEAELLEYGQEIKEYLEISGELLPKKIKTSTESGQNLNATIKNYGEEGKDKTSTKSYNEFGKIKSECSTSSGCTNYDYEAAIMPQWRTEQMEGWPRERRYENYIVNGSSIGRGDLGKLQLEVFKDEHYSRYLTFTDYRGNVVCTRNYKGSSSTYRKTQYFYDARNRLVEVERNDGESYTYQYEPQAGGGMKTTTTNPQGISTYTITNLQGEVIEEKVKSGAVFTYEYTADGKIQHKKHNNNPIISYTYYSSGQGKLGQVHTKTVQIIGSSNAITYTYAYDNLGRLTETIIDRPSGTAVIEIQDFDALDNPIEVKNAVTYNGQTEIFTEYFTYDNASRLLTHEVNNLFGENYFLSKSEYRLDDQAKNVTLGHNPQNPEQFLEKISYGYNRYGWLKRINNINECNKLPVNNDEVSSGDQTIVKEGHVKVSYNINNLLNGRINIRMQGLSQSINENREILYSEEARDTLDFISYSSIRNLAPRPQSITYQYYDIDTRDYTEPPVETDVTYQLQSSLDTTHQLNFSGSLGDHFRKYAVATLTKNVVEHIKESGYRINNQDIRRIEGEIRGFLDSEMFKEYNDDCNGNHESLFSERIYYKQGLSELNGEEQYNGNISGVKYRTLDQQGYSAWGYQYDGYGQLKQARYGEKSYLSTAQGQSPWVKDQYNVNIGYKDDAIGNIETIERKGLLNNGNYGLVDDLTMSYNGGVLESVTENSLPDKGYKISTGTNQINTESNTGNIKDYVGKEIESIQYNYLDLPTTINFTGNATLTVTYDAEGNKLQQTYSDNDENIETTKRWISGLEITSKTINGINRGAKIYNHQYGRVVYQNTVGDSQITRAEYSLTDHLGNIRVVFTDANSDWSISRDIADGEVSSIHHYYPFGMEMTGDWQNYDSELLSYDYKYNGIESLEDRQLNLATYRILDPGIGRWYQIDPEEESFYGLSPYTSMANSPTTVVDPEGDFIIAALIGAAVGVMGNGIINSINGDPFFQGWGMAAVMGFIGGATGYGVGFSDMLSNIGGQIATGAASAGSAYIPSYDISIGSNFTLSINPALLVSSGGGWGVGVSPSVSYSDENFGFSVSSSIVYGKNSTTNIVGWHNSVGGSISARVGEHTILSYSGTNFFGDVGNYSHGLTATGKNWSVGLENDFPFSDKYRTTALSASLYGVRASVNLWTGNPGAKYDKETGNYIPHGKYNPNKYRAGLAYLEYKNYRAGINSEKYIRAPIQNGWHWVMRKVFGSSGSHNFRVLNIPTEFYGGYSNLYPNSYY